MGITIPVPYTGTVFTGTGKGMAKNTWGLPVSFPTDWRKRIERPNPRLCQDLWTSLFRRGICETSEPQTLGSRHRAGTGSSAKGL
jgi:hypothetical protein